MRIQILRLKTRGLMKRLRSGNGLQKSYILLRHGIQNLIHSHQRICFRFLLLPKIGVQNLNPWRSHHLADSINFFLARIFQRPYGIADLALCHNEHHPNATIKRAHHLARRNGARAHQPAKDGRQRPPRDVDARAKRRGQRAGHVIHESAAGDMRHGLYHRARAGGGEDAARIDGRRREQGPSERRAGVPWARGGVGRTGAREDGAHEREAVGMQACGW